MPTVLSTLRDNVYGGEWSFPYNCYEVGHAWTPYCTSAAIEIGLACFKNAVPLYSSLYLFTQLGVARKYDKEAFIETSKSILTSSSFLAFNFFCGMSISCFLRNNSDRYYYRVQCFIPALVASYMSLLIERPSRRASLAFYIANMSSELIYKWAADRRYIRPLPYGETLLFAACMAVWLRFVRIHGFGHDPVSTALKYLMGSQEAKSRAKSKPQASAITAQESPREEDPRQAIAKSNTDEPVRKSLINLTGQAITNTLNLLFDAHAQCPHKGISCVEYTASPVVSRFVLGYLARSAMNLMPQAKLLRKQPGQAFKNAFSADSSIKFGLFLSSFVGLSRLTHCLLRRYSDKQEDWHSAVAGGISGLSMAFSPRSTLSLYVLWKCIEQYFFLGVKQGTIKYPEQMICALYAVSGNILLYTFALEPKFIRSSYMKFIDGLTDHMLQQANRMVLDIFCENASLGYEDWFPNLDPKHCSRQFHELIFNWMIQPYE